MHHFRKYLTREQIFTIPNFMSLFRLVLVPFIIWVYYRGAYDAAAGLVLLSAATDILDGIIARKFNMVSDLGKMLDPLCDKLTHAALLICLLMRYHFIWFVFGLLAVKEITMLILGSITVKRCGEVHSAKWYGKLCTVILEGSTVALMLFPSVPLWVVRAAACLCCAAMLFSLAMYVVFFLRQISEKKRETQDHIPCSGEELT